MNSQQQDKPLYFQGKWWFISKDRRYFWWPDPNVYQRIIYYWIRHDLTGSNVDAC